MGSHALVTATVLLAFVVGSAESAPSPESDPINARDLTYLKQYLADPQNTPGDLVSIAPQLLSMLGRDDLAAPLPQLPNYRRKVCQPLLDKGEPIDPIMAIADHAAQASVTMINEAHDMPQTRAFIMKVAAALHAKGYIGYAAETFDLQIGKDAPAWPLAEDGYYSREPVYGRLIRQLRNEKYRLLAYEFVPVADRKAPFQQQIDEREMGEASNLMMQQESLVRSFGEKAKLLVHVGYGHNAEYVSPSRSPFMGQRFKEASGIDPFTVDQTGYSSPSDAYVVCDLPATETPRPYDMVVGMPKLHFVRSRPTYRLALGDHFVDVPPKLLRKDELAIVDARPVGEPQSSVPMDRIMLRPGEIIPLLLPSGRYNVSAWTEKSGWSKIVSISVGQKH